MSVANDVRPAPPVPPSPSSPKVGFARNIVLFIAIALSLVTAAAGVLWLTNGQVTARANFDNKVIALLQAGEQADRAFFTELQQIVTEHVTNLPADQEPSDKAAKELKDAVDAVGLSNLKLDTSSSDDKAKANQQIESLFQDPAKRLQESRDQLRTGTPAGAENPASFDAMHQAWIDFTEQAPGLMKDSKILPEADAYKAAVKENMPWPVSSEEPANSPRAETLAKLVAAGQEQVDTAAKAPFIYMIITIAVGVVAIAAWVMFVLRRGKEASASPKAPKVKAPKEPKAAKAPKPAKEAKPAKDTSPDADAAVPAPPPVPASSVAPTLAKPAETPVAAAPAKPAVPPASSPQAAPSPAPVGARPRIQFAPLSGRTGAAPTSPTGTPTVGSPSTTPTRPVTPPARPEPATPSASGQAPAPQPAGSPAGAKPAGEEAPKRPAGRIPWRTTPGGDK